MNLNNFEEYIDDVILKRGKDYFKNGHVVRIEEITTNHYVVEVEGSDTYMVEVTIDSDKNIMETSCDCPYDFGEFCKHQVAAFFSLRNEHTGISEKPRKLKQIEKKIDLPTLLSKFSKEKLQTIILDLSQVYPAIEKQLLFQYAPEKNEISASKKLIKEYIRKATYRGFIEWNRVRDALIGVNLTLEKARDKDEIGEIETAVSLCLLAQTYVIEMLGYCDDSNGEVSIVMRESFEIIDGAVMGNAYKMDEHQQMKLYEMLIKQALDERYEGWTDWKIYLLQSCIYLASNMAIRQSLEKELEQMIKVSKKEDSWSAEYFIEQVKLVQLELLERFEGEESALQFIQDNIQFSNFREKAILFQLQKENYQEVIRLCLEGEEADKNYRGLVHKWKQYRLQAYEGQGDIESQRKVLLEFVLKDHYEYYLKLKKLYGFDEWTTVLEHILQKFESLSYLPGTYVEILKLENLSKKLLDYCQQKPSSIEKLYTYLLKDYKDEVNEVFKTFIESASKQASDRKKYKQVCSIIKTYKKACGQSNALQLMHKLKELYNRRPAFIDELEKLERKYK